MLKIKKQEAPQEYAAPEYEYVDGTKPKEKSKSGNSGGGEGLNRSFGLDGQPRAAVVFGINNFLILVSDPVILNTIAHFKIKIALVVGFSVVGTQVTSIKNFLM